LLAGIGFATETEIALWRAILIGSKVAMGAPTTHVNEVCPRKDKRGV